MKEKYLGKDAYGCNFNSKQSMQAVTSYVQQGSIGNMTLIDTPGLNDNEASRSDKRIFFETIKNISIKLKDIE